MTSLVKEIDKLVNEDASKKNNATSFVVVLSDDVDGTKEKLTKIAKENKITLPLTINADKAKAPAAYKVSDDAKFTVLFYKNKKVTANLTFNEASKEKLTEVAKAAKETFQS